MTVLELVEVSIDDHQIIITSFHDEACWLMCSCGWEVELPDGISFGQVTDLARVEHINTIETKTTSGANMVMLSAPQLIKAYAAVDVHTTATIQADTTVTGFSQVFVDIVMKTITGGTTPAFTFSVYRKDGQTTPNQLLLATASSVNATSAVVTFGVGPGLAVNSVPGNLMAIGWTVTGAPTAATADVTFWGVPALAY